MSDDSVRFVDSDTVLFQRNGMGLTLQLLQNVNRDDFQVDNPLTRIELLAWAQLAATRQQTASLEKLAAAVNQLALGSHSTAEAVREQTARMQQNIDDARADVMQPVEVLEMVADKLQKLGILGEGNGADLIAAIGGALNGTQVRRGG